MPLQQDRRNTSNRNNRRRRLLQFSPRVRNLLLSRALDQLPLKRRKVWTNDEVVSLRTPADDYQVEKEAKEAADAKAAAKEAAIRAALKSEKEPPPDIKLPATPEETEKMLKDTQDDIQEEMVILDKLRKELLDAPTEQQVDKQNEIDRLTASLRPLRRDAKALQDHLQTLRGKSQAENLPPPPAAPSYLHPLLSLSSFSLHTGRCLRSKCSCVPRAERRCIMVRCGIARGARRCMALRFCACARIIRPC